MAELHLPFLEAAVLVPLIGGIWLARVRDALAVHHWAIAISATALLCTVGAWQDFVLNANGTVAAHDRWDLVAALTGGQATFVVDELTAPLLPMIATLFWLTILTTQKTKMHRFSFGRSLVSEAILIATFASREPWLLIALLVAGTIPPFLELRRRRRPTRVYVLHMTSFALLLVGGWWMVVRDSSADAPSPWAIAPLLIAILLRCGVVPFHLWVTDLFEHAALGNALVFMAPITGALAAVRLLIPISPDWVLKSIGIVALVTAVYAAGMAIVQREARRFFCYLLISQSAFVLVGFGTLSAISLTGALSLWLSIGIALGGLGLTLRALEARFGRLGLTDFRGLYEQSPAIATCFAITALASVGFPGTASFVGAEMLIDAAVTAYPYVGVSLLVAMSLCGIAIVRTYFLLFTGRRHPSSVSMLVGVRERLAVIVLALLLLGSGLYPQPGVVSRHRAAVHLLEARSATAARTEHGQPVRKSQTLRSAGPQAKS